MARHRRVHILRTGGETPPVDYRAAPLLLPSVLDSF
jgi:hypothetical protein